MKKDIHPEYHKDAKVSCACGHTFKVGSTVKDLHVEICSNCHPFYTGKANIIDTAGRVERYKQRRTKAEETMKKTLTKTQKKAKTVKRKTQQKSKKIDA